MKRILTTAFLTTMVLGTTMTFTSCSSDDDDSPSTVTTPQQVFTGGLPKSVGNMTIETNAKGQVVSVKDGNETATFEYKEAASRSTASSPDVIMTVVYENEKLVCNLHLNKEGFVSHCDETENYTYGTQTETENETWDFTYNKDGQLLSMRRSEDKETTTIKYQDGNIVETSTVSADEPDESNSYKISYTSDAVTSPIANKGCIMLFDQTLGIDLDEMEYAYYAGLLGKATKSLPVKLVEDGDYTLNFSWTLNSSGYPTLLKYDNETCSFAW